MTKRDIKRAREGDVLRIKRGYPGAGTHVTFAGESASDDHVLVIMPGSMSFQPKPSKMFVLIKGSKGMSAKLFLFGFMLSQLIAPAIAGDDRINGKPIEIGAGGVPYVVGGTAQENWLVQQQQHLADKELLDQHKWPALSNPADWLVSPY